MQGPSCQTPGARPHQEAPGRCSEGQAGRLPPSRTQRDASYTSYIDSATLTCSSMTHTLNWLPTDGQDGLLWPEGEETLSTVAPEGTPKLAQIV